MIAKVKFLAVKNLWKVKKWLDSMKFDNEEFDDNTIELDYSKLDMHDKLRLVESDLMTEEEVDECNYEGVESILIYQE